MAAQFDRFSGLLDIKEGTLTLQEGNSMVDKTPAATADKVREFEGSGTPHIGGSYEIKVGGHLDEGWSEWLGELSLTHDAQGNTLLAGSIADQSALYGILVKIRDLGLPLISLTPH